MADYDIRPLQLRILKILLAVDKVCKEHGLRYYIRQFGIKKCPKKLVISLLFCNFIVDNQLITNIYSDDYH